MGIKNYSTVICRSNLQSVTKKYNIEDKTFLSNVTDPFILEILHKDDRYKLTEIQKQEFNSSSMHCCFAAPDDYPFGTIRNLDGKLQYVCKCINTNCKLFKQCRPDFRTEELAVLEENQIHQHELNEFENRINNSDLNFERADRPSESEEIREKRTNEADLSVLSRKFKVSSSDKSKVKYAPETNRKADEYEGKKTTEEIKTVINGRDKGKDSFVENQGKRDEDFTNHHPDTLPQNDPVVISDREISGSENINLSENIPLDNREKLDVSQPVNPPDFSSFQFVVQGKIIQGSVTERNIVNAGPGTGKTYTLIEKIKYLLNSNTAGADEILVLCFSKAAVKVIRSRLKDAADKDLISGDWNKVEIRTFDSFSTYVLAYLVNNMREILPANYSLEAENYDERIKSATEVFLHHHDILQSYKHMIVDEVQDLVGVRAELVLAILDSLPGSCGFTLLGDSCQALYDYLSQSDKSVMSSSKFYQNIFRNFPEAHYYSLEKNYRQENDLEKLTKDYRQAIINQEPGECIRQADVLFKQLPDANIDIRHFTPQLAEEYLRCGSLGILTRTNAQALQISAWMRTEGTKHLLQRPAGVTDFSDWIFNILSLAETDVISQDEFKSIFELYYPQVKQKSCQYWNALVSTQKEQLKSRYSIKSLLQGIMQNDRNPLLYINPLFSAPNITVSNVHRAKGMEFDSVLLVSDVISGISDPKNQDLTENNVCYVALTRPKKVIEKFNLGKQYIYSKGTKERRCFRKGVKKYLSHYEVGYAEDFDKTTYAENTQLQDYIQNQISVGDRLKLLKCKKDVHSYVVYKLVPEDDEKTVLAYTTKQFANGMEKAIQKIFKSYYPVDHKYFPEILNDLYVDQRTTCIATNTGLIKGAVEYGDVCIWKGLAVSGFAQSEIKSY